MQKDALLEELRRLSPADRREILAQFSDETGGGDRPRVFLSYSRDDTHFVRDLMEGLERGGVEVWFDVRELLVGEDYQTATEKGLKECNYCLVVVSPYSMKSPEVARELAVARQAGTAILPVILQDVAIADSLRNLQWIDFRFHFEAPLGGLIAQLHGHPAAGLSEQRLMSARRPLLTSHGFIPLFQKSAPASVHSVNALLLAGAQILLFLFVYLAKARVTAAASGLMLIFSVVMVRTAFRIVNRQATRLEMRLDLATYLFFVPCMLLGLLSLLQQDIGPSVIWSLAAYASILLAAILITEFSRSFKRRLCARLPRLEFLPPWLRRRKQAAAPASS